MSDIIRLIRVWILRNPYQSIFIVLGFIAAILIAVFGFMKFLGIFAFTLVCYLIGRVIDKRISLRDVINRFSANRYR